MLPCLGAGSVIICVVTFLRHQEGTQSRECQPCLSWVPSPLPWASGHCRALTAPHARRPWERSSCWGPVSLLPRGLTRVPAHLPRGPLWADRDAFHSHWGSCRAPCWPPGLSGWAEMRPFPGRAGRQLGSSSLSPWCSEDPSPRHTCPRLRDGQVQPAVVAGPGAGVKADGGCSCSCVGGSRRPGAEGSQCSSLLTVTMRRTWKPPL